MLSIHKLAAGQARYYLDQAERRVDVLQSIGDGVEEYYAGGVEARGEWMGVSARELGLTGSVDGEHLRAVLEGRDRDGAQLRDSAGAIRVAGYDLTLSAPKSVSVLFGLGDPTLLRPAQMPIAHPACPGGPSHSVAPCGGCPLRPEREEGPRVRAFSMRLSGWRLLDLDELARLVDDDVAARDLRRVLNTVSSFCSRSQLPTTRLDSSACAAVWKKSTEVMMPLRGYGRFANAFSAVTVEEIHSGQAASSADLKPPCMHAGTPTTPEGRPCRSVARDPAREARTRGKSRTRSRSIPGRPRRRPDIGCVTDRSPSRPGAKSERSRQCEQQARRQYPAWDSFQVNGDPCRQARAGFGPLACFRRGDVQPREGCSRQPLHDESRVSAHDRRGDRWRSWPRHSRARSTLGSTASRQSGAAARGVARRLRRRGCEALRCEGVLLADADCRLAEGGRKRARVGGEFARRLTPARTE